MNPVHGIHHVTAICGQAQENLDFYTGVLGMRLVKRTVNQDVPDTYHLFYADGEANPGTDITFFPWPQMPRWRKGAGLAVEVGMAIPKGSVPFWVERLKSEGVSFEGPEDRFGEATLCFHDPDGLELALTETSDLREFAPWQQGPVSEQNQVRGFHTMRLWEHDLAKSADFLRDALGFELVGEDAGWHRFSTEGGGSGKWIDVRELPSEHRGAWGTGAVHHVAFRVDDEEELLEIRQQAVEAGSQPTPVIDRFWFKSVYFKEPGGVLFELSTDGPGFAVDEELAQLGEQLILPPWLEPHRQEIESALPPLRVTRMDDLKRREESID
jgi:glyoxalase family protein